MPQARERNQVDFSLDAAAQVGSLSILESRNFHGKIPRVDRIVYHNSRSTMESANFRRSIGNREIMNLNGNAFPATDARIKSFKKGKIKYLFSILGIVNRFIPSRTPRPGFSRWSKHGLNHFLNSPSTTPLPPDSTSFKKSENDFGSALVPPRVNSFDLSNFSLSSLIEPYADGQQ